jgi:hypothetical protein
VLTLRGGTASLCLCCVPRRACFRPYRCASLNRTWDFFFLNPVEVANAGQTSPLLSTLDVREDHNGACFIIRDQKRPALSYVYFEDEPGCGFRRSRPGIPR